jgi:8-oxo-dGTP pyrophosphatase MutT (NUDIX family)
MGKRGETAPFMPGRFAFPGGAVDAVDFLPGVEWPCCLEDGQVSAIASSREVAVALLFAAVRELYEETGLILGQPAEANDDVRRLGGWETSFAAGYMPDLSLLRPCFRAVTPQNRPRRFDARFFVVNVDHLDLTGSDTEDGELSDLQWLTVPAARSLFLPFITDVVLAELESPQFVSGIGGAVPYFIQDAIGPRFRYL